MKTITLHQPWASLVAEGMKTIETRRLPPAGPWPAFEGQRRMPGSAIAPGDELAIAAAARTPDWDDYEDGHYFGTLGDDTRSIQWARPVRLPAEWHYYLGGDGPRPLPLGAVVATCTLVDVVPIGQVRDISPTLSPPWYWIDPRHSIAADGRYTHGARSDQFDFGDFTPGRYAWLLADIVKLDEPVPARGRQGLWEWAAA